MGKKQKKATHKTKFKMNGETTIIETNLFGSTGHITYTGFGIHEDKCRKADRRNRKIEEKRAKLGDYE
jgi:hypothetical protein